jgi:hypothetical protein
MFRALLLGLLALLACLATLGLQKHLLAAPPFADEDVARLRKVIRPQLGEDPFDTIPWEISLWDARVKAAAAGKPVLLWEMDGHPLGCG